MWGAILDSLFFLNQLSFADYLLVRSPLAVGWAGRLSGAAAAGDSRSDIDVQRFALLPGNEVCPLLLIKVQRFSRTRAGTIMLRRLRNPNLFT